MLLKEYKREWLFLVVLLGGSVSYPANEDTFILDIDLDGKTEALTDGLLVLRYLFGFSGASLTDGAVANEATRPLSTNIQAYMATHEAYLDIDEDGEIGALTDGLLLLRYLFGFSGTSLTDGALGNGAMRTTSESVEAYLAANQDTDTDGDGIGDTVDIFPSDSEESFDADSDGLGNNADTDYDNDDILDIDEEVDSPPFWGTLFVSPVILTEVDPSTFAGLEKIPDAPRVMFDRRYGWITLTPHLFQATFSDGLSIEVQVNPEFETQNIGEEVALRYLEVIGQLPTLLRQDVQTIWLHKGEFPFGGGNNNLLIHHAQGLLYEEDGLLGEVFLHEASHTSLDSYHASAPDWLAAQNADGRFISTYARDNPLREDIAETIPLCFAVRYKSSRIPSGLIQTIWKTIPNRMRYCDSLIFK